MIALDWKAEKLPPTFTIPTGPRDSTPLPQAYPPRVIVLTGGSGFIGEALVEAMLKCESVTMLHCVVVRDSDRLASLALHPKLEMQTGNISHPKLSLGSRKQELLAGTADIIVRNGADVSFPKGYSSLRRPNVGSTRFLVSLAAARRAPFHHIMSAAIGRLLLQMGAVDMPFAAVSVAGTPPGPA